MDMTTLSAKVTNSYHVIDLQFLPSNNYNKNCTTHNRKKRHKCASKSRGDKAYSVPPVPKSRGICPSVHPTIDTHAKARGHHRQTRLGKLAPRLDSSRAHAQDNHEVMNGITQGGPCGHRGDQKDL